MSWKRKILLLIVHLPASQKSKYRWIVYLCEDTACKLLDVGSTMDVCGRWANTKKACRDRNLDNTGLYKHFLNGCPADNGTGDLSHLRWTLVDFIDTSAELLAKAEHQPRFFYNFLFSVAEASTNPSPRSILMFFLFLFWLAKAKHQPRFLLFLIFGRGSLDQP